MAHYTDSQAKAILRNPKHWRTRTQQWGVAGKKEYWIRGRPNDTADDKNPLPKLSLPGAKLFRIQPDGMWLYFNKITFVDVLAIEVCATIQNVNDKRSRYFSTGAGLMLVVPKVWFFQPVRVQHGGRLSRKDATGCLDNVDLQTEDDVNVPVRFLRALFVIPDAKYADWMANHVPAGHEFYMKHNSLKSGTAQRVQKFLGRISFQSHFCTHH